MHGPAHSLNGFLPGLPATRVERRNDHGSISLRADVATRSLARRQIAASHVDWARNVKRARRVEGHRPAIHAAHPAVGEAAVHAASEHAGPGAVLGRLDAGRRLAAERFGDELVDDVIELAPGPPDEARVTRVTVGGRTVVEDGALVRADIAELRAKAREAAADLWPRMRALP